VISWGSSIYCQLRWLVEHVLDERMSLQESNRQLKPEQAAAAHRLDRHISVTAGPGSGKTTVLVERYLHILREHKLPSIDQIVAITFTNRAANAMRERLRKELDKLLRNSNDEERQRWMRYKRTLDGAVITTIHGFCMRLLREFPVEAQLDPQFILLDEHRAAMLLEGAVEESLTEFINRGDEPVTRLTAGLGRPRLANALFQMYLKVRGQGLSFEHILKQTTESHSQPEAYGDFCEELDTLMAHLISARGLTSKAAEKRLEAERRWPHVRELLLSKEFPLADYCALITEFREVARPDARGPVAAIVKRLDELLWGDSKERCFGRLPQMRFDLFAKEYATELVKLLKNIDQRFLEKKQLLSVLDFDDLQQRTLQLLDRPEVIRRASQRYKFFLVDEFQDTNSLQRGLMERLALKSNEGANLFIVGDRKQSIYGFRGADVDVFSEMTKALIAAGGESMPLALNFRSQPPLINFFNFLFERLFKHDEKSSTELAQLGYVNHEPSVAQREVRDKPPLVELMIDTLPAGEADPKAGQTPRERDARQLAQRIVSLTGSADVSPAGGAIAQDAENAVSSVVNGPDSTPAGLPRPRPLDVCSPTFSYRDIALLFRAMTDVPVYETEFRRAGIPYQTVLGKGFYEREEITDLIQLCRFLDNRTDELALAAVLRSPLAGISDDALLALRLAPKIGETPAGEAPQPRRHPRPLLQALRKQQEIDFITNDERAALDRASEFLAELVERRNRYPVADLLRFAVKKSEYTTVVAATFDGAQRLGNVEKLFTLAERFERSGAHLIRDFVQYVRDFEAIGSRESEGQLDDSANAVKLMTIHQAKGLEFPVVIIPDLHRSSVSWEEFFILDRHRGLTLKVPDGRGQMVAGGTFTLFSERAKLREEFESMRLLYVAATRAQERLILSGAIRELSELGKRESWLRWIWQALDLGNRSRSDVLELERQTQLQLTVNLAAAQGEQVASGARVNTNTGPPAASTDLEQSLPQLFPLISPVEAEGFAAVHRFSVTQLLNCRRCPRQYYFDRILQVPVADELAVWNNAEAPEPPANLTATLKGAVIHRFCETYADGDDLEERLRRSFGDVIRSRQAQLADRLVDIDTDAAMKDLLPLAKNYLSSKVFQRVQAAAKFAGELRARFPANQVGLWSELSFRLRRPPGILTGTIDKLLVSPSEDGKGFEIEIIDFKTNRISRQVGTQSSTTISQSLRGEAPTLSQGTRTVRSAMRAGGRRSQYAAAQFAFNFSPLAGEARSELVTESDLNAAPKSQIMESAVSSVEDQVQLAASDYQLQMQAYALAVRELMPGLERDGRIKVTLHFLDPDYEYHLEDSMLATDVCARSIDDAILELISSSQPEQFPVRPAPHCRMCNFLSICAAGRQWVGEKKLTAAASPSL
jgi:ATP-dependent helicase/nuclease subunit A